MTNPVDRNVIPAALDALLRTAERRSHDINEHLRTLLALGREVERITEFGVRNGFGSTIAFLAAQPKMLTSYDINPCENMDLLVEASETPWVFIQGSSLDVTIEPTDLLFIDTLHTYEQLLTELTEHHDRVSKYIVLHDTVTYGQVSETTLRSNTLSTTLSPNCVGNVDTRRSITRPPTVS
jgi:predicted O-methyltransferase YrrM